MGVCVPEICRTSWGAAGSSSEVSRHSHGRNFLCCFASFPSATADAVRNRRNQQEFKTEHRKFSHSPHLCDGEGVTGKGLALGQLRVLLLQRRQLLSLLQTAKHVIRQIGTDVYDTSVQKNVLAFWSMMSRLFFSLWKFSLSCWACRAICEDCFFSVAILSCIKNATLSCWHWFILQQHIKHNKSYSEMPAWPVKGFITTKHNIAAEELDNTFTLFLKLNSFSDSALCFWEKIPLKQESLSFWCLQVNG